METVYLKQSMFDLAIFIIYNRSPCIVLNLFQI